MQIRYDRVADVLLALLRDEPPVDAIEEAGGVIVSYGEDRRPAAECGVPPSDGSWRDRAQEGLKWVHPS